MLFMHSTLDNLTVSPELEASNTIALTMYYSKRDPSISSFWSVFWGVCWNILVLHRIIIVYKYYSGVSAMSTVLTGVAVWGLEPMRMPLTMKYEVVVL